MGFADTEDNNASVATLTPVEYFILSTENRYMKLEG